jgi:hypothetical protein
VPRNRVKEDAASENRGVRFDRVERLLALLLLEQRKDANPSAKVGVLRSVGFSNQEIGDLLGTSAENVRKLYYEATTRAPSRAARGSRRPATRNGRRDAGAKRKQR